MGERGYNPHITRRRVNDAFLRALADFAVHGPEIIRQVGREAPGTYMKVLALLMPKDVRTETSREVVGALSDEQLASGISELTERIESRLRGNDAKVIEAVPADDLPGGPANEAELPRGLRQKPQTWRPRRTRKAAKALKAMTVDCENGHSLPSPDEEPLK